MATENPQHDALTQRIIEIADNAVTGEPRAMRQVKNDTMRAVES
jgi:hypothetical protein